MQSYIFQSKRDLDEIGVSSDTSVTVGGCSANSDDTGVSSEADVIAGICPSADLDDTGISAGAVDVIDICPSVISSKYSCRSCENNYEMWLNIYLINLLSYQNEKLNNIYNCDYNDRPIAMQQYANQQLIG